MGLSLWSITDETATDQLETNIWRSIQRNKVGYVSGSAARFLPVRYESAIIPKLTCEKWSFDLIMRTELFIFALACSMNTPAILCITRKVRKGDE